MSSRCDLGDHDFDADNHCVRCGTQRDPQACPFCGAKIDKNYGNIYFCGTEIESKLRTTACWSRETRVLRMKLTELENKLLDPDMVMVQRKYLKIYLHRNAHYVEEIEEAWDCLNSSLVGSNPADDPSDCLACMGATGSAVRHTCKK